MDPYVYPGTNILKNLRDIRDQHHLDRVEAISTARIGELQLDPKAGQFDISHLKSIHRHIFQDIYPWAGEFRKVNIARTGQFFGSIAESVGKDDALRAS